MSGGISGKVFWVGDQAPERAADSIALAEDRRLAAIERAKVQRELDEAAGARRTHVEQQELLARQRGETYGNPLQVILYREWLAGSGRTDPDGSLFEAWQRGEATIDLEALRQRDEARQAKADRRSLQIEKVERRPHPWKRTEDALHEVHPDRY